MSEEVLVPTILLILGVIFLLTVSAWRESRVMNRQHGATIEQESRQNEDFEQLIGNLQQQPLDADLHDALRAFCAKKRGYTEPAYRAALDLVSQTHGDAAVQSLASELGRLSFGLKRRDGKPTFADDQDIENDIRSRC